MQDAEKELLDELDVEACNSSEDEEQAKRPNKVCAAMIYIIHRLSI